MLLKVSISQQNDWETREHTLFSLWPSQLIFQVMLEALETLCLSKLSVYNNMAFHTFSVSSLVVRLTSGG